ncbi:hypothetical protein GQ44DRAFT_293350 [Phaeosphaeriaceae sp. PMI808]|nr:hypothetical protein GQ44DRAFT_293350 [Phaeosphaeriaceae sp. PMI808]
MIHQSFLSKSLKDERYTYTRWAVAKAAKNIIGSYTMRDAEEPQVWVEQAFIVTAGICLMLDLFHRSSTDAEVAEYQASVEQAIRLLQQFFTSTIAMHGVRLLFSLVQEYHKIHGGIWQILIPGKTCPNSLADDEATEPSFAPQNPALPSSWEVPSSNDEVSQFNFDVDTAMFGDLMDYLPTETGIDNSIFVDTICGIATPYLP